MTKIEKEINNLSKKYDVNVIFDDFYDLGGYINYDDPNHIFIANCCKKDRSETLRIFFHELGHIFSLRTGKWKAYHSSLKTYHDKKNYYKKYLRTALKAERWVDNWAYNELKKYDKRIKYDFPYYGNDAKKWFYETHLNDIKIKIK